MGNGAYEKPHFIYDRTTKKLKLQTSGDDGEDSFTVLNSFNGKRVVFWLTKKGAGFRLLPLRNETLSFFYLKAS